MNGGLTWLALVTHGTAPLTATVTGLVNGNTYYVEVRAVNSAGSGPAVGPISVTPAGVPGQPTAVRAVRGDSAATLTFTAPFANGSPISGYTITVLPGGQTVPCSASPCLVDGLDNGTSYQFRVQASNAVGAGVASTRTAAIIPQAAPAPVVKLLVAVQGTSATITWAPPTLTNGASITGYTVTVEPGGRTCTPAPVTARTCTFDDLTPGSQYTFSVVVHSTAGDLRAARSDQVTVSMPASGAVPAGTPTHRSESSGGTTAGVADTGVPVIRLASVGSLLIVFGYATLALEGRRRRKRDLA